MLATTNGNARARVRLRRIRRGRCAGAWTPGRKLGCLMMKLVRRSDDGGKLLQIGYESDDGGKLLQIESE